MQRRLGASLTQMRLPRENPLLLLTEVGLIGIVRLASSRAALLRWTAITTSYGAAT